MSVRQWQESGRFSFGLILAAVKPEDSRIMILINGENTDWTMHLPKGHWIAVLDTAQPTGLPALVDSIEKLRMDAEGSGTVAIVTQAQVTLQAEKHDDF